MMDSYELPDDGIFRVLNFSGGRSSGLMLYEVLRANGGTLDPDRCRVVFTNTGKEVEETLRFVRDCSSNFGVKVHWIEFAHDPDAKPKSHFREVDFDTASRAGEPFDALIARSKILPNPVMRKCTADLKVRPTTWFVRSLGHKRHRNIIGFRADEPKRVERAFKDPKGCSMDFPLWHAKVERKDVAAFWDRQNFDLALPNSDHGNCDLCFLKGRRKIVSLMRIHPERAQWWIDKESAIRKKGGAAGAFKKLEKAQFRQNWKYADLLAEATQAADMVGFEGADTDGGPLGDCFCGD